jgi:drug/metabolite transporter (DMT)-like permease
MAESQASSALGPERGVDAAAMAALIAGALAISAAPILVRLSQTGPAAAGFWRLALALPILAVAGVSSRPTSMRPPSRAMVLAGVMFALDLGCWHYGIRYTSVANATLLPNLNPVLVTAGAWILLKERPRPIFLVGMAAAVLGAGLVAVADRGHGASGANTELGDALSASTAVWYAFYFLAVRSARAKDSTLRIMVWTSLVGAPLLLATAIALGERVTPSGLAGWAAVGGLGVVHVAGQGAIAWALGRAPAAPAALMMLVQPVASAALAWLIFGETLMPLQTVGGAVVLAGIAIAQAPARHGAAVDDHEAA